MFDAKKLLDQLVGPEGAALAQQVLAQASGTLGQGLDAASRGAGDLLGADRVDQAKDYLSRNAEGLGVGAAAGGLLGLLLGTQTGRQVGGSALKLGTLATLGGLAYQAYTEWQKGQSGAALPPAGAPAALPEGEQQALAEALIVAMISAAKADGVIDPKEYQTIAGKAAQAGMDTAASAFLEAEMSSPLDLDRVVGYATSPSMASQIYAASCLAIAPDKTSEKAYLETLATRLGLDAGLKAEIERRVAGARG